MKTAEQMMCEWMQSQLRNNQTFTINSEQYLEIYNWYQSVQLAMEKQNMIDIPDLYDVPIGAELSTGDYIVKWTGNEDAWKHAHAGEKMKYAKRVDGNHHEIIQGLRDCGYKVKDTSKYGDGFPDCIVAGGGRVVMLEIKQGSAKLTDAEKEFHEAFYGLGLHVVRTLEQALDVMRKETI
ncbi:MAG: hypothetical protein US85_C0025G0009 [Candidatus Shapirobacteria bacterium GW2011_GWF1_38_23]|nr:MAG: hypothetical protein US85_C0025G0009 [Candidatus Shapirobacteria bacterium GW2011_GWF1_38_23]